MSTNHDLLFKLEVYQEALDIIAGNKQCLDNLMSNSDIAKEAIEKVKNKEIESMLVRSSLPPEILMDARQETLHVDKSIKHIVDYTRRKDHK